MEHRGATETSAAVTARAFGQFYLPLAATSLLLTATNPVLAAALARTAEPANALAGYSVAFALCGVLYSPLLVVQQVAATTVLDGGALAPVRRFALIVGALFSALAALVAFSAAGPLVFGRLIGVTGSVYAEAMNAMALLWPVPLLTAVRSVHQGRLVAGHHTRPIALSTGVRTALLAAVAFGLAGVLGGARAGALAFLMGLVAETAMVAIAPSETPRFRTRTAEEAQVADQRLLRFSLPLMANVLLWWSTPLIISGVLARTPEPALALAAFAVIEAFAWFIAAPVGQLQHCSIALVNCGESHRSVRRWAGMVSVGVALLLGVFALPGIREPVLRVIFDLDRELLATVGGALPLAALYPLLYGHRQYYQGLFVRTGRTAVVGWGAALRVATIVITAVIAFQPFCHHGALLGVGLAVVGLMVEDVYLAVMSVRWALPLLDAPPAISKEVLAP